MAKGDTRCEDGRLMRHDPQNDDPHLETDIGKCPECEGNGCPCDECDGDGNCPNCFGEDDSCPFCLGEGECPECHGSGMLGG